LSEPRVVVIQLSEAFSQFLRDLVRDLGAHAEFIKASEAQSQLAGAAAVLLAAVGPRHVTVPVPGPTQQRAIRWALSSGIGAMAVVKNVDTNKVEELCATTSGKLCIAVYNSPTSCTISGEKASIDMVRTKLKI